MTGQRSDRRDVLCILALTAVCLLLRLPALDRIALNPDESQYEATAAYLVATGTSAFELPHTSGGTFALYKALSECTYLLGEFNDAEQLFDLLLARARDRHDTSEALNIRIAFYSSVGRFTKAIEAGFEGLELFGLELRSAGADLRGAIERELNAISEQLAGREISSLAALSAQELKERLTGAQASYDGDVRVEPSEEGKARVV